METLSKVLTLASVTEWLRLCLGWSKAAWGQSTAINNDHKRTDSSKDHDDAVKSKIVVENKSVIEQ